MSKKRAEKPRTAGAAPPGEPSGIARERGALAAVWNSIAPHLKLLAGITLLALGTRFFQLSEPDLWMDEIVIFQEAFAGEYKTVSYHTHAAHLAVVGFFMRTLGHTEFGLRFWGALLGALAIPLLWICGHLVRGPVFATIAALLATFNTMLLVYAQDGNYYGGMTFYTVIQILGLLLYLNRAYLLGVLLIVVFGIIGFKNHPIHAVPAATIAGAAMVATVLFPTIRRDLFALAPARWLHSPGVPLLGAIVLAVALLSPRILRFLPRVIDPGASTLTNVEFGSFIFVSHFARFGVNFFDFRGIDAYIWWYPLVLFIVGVAVAVYLWRREGNIGALTLAATAVVLFLGSYFLLFSLKLNRNFNLRYYIFLVPFYLLGIAMLLQLLAAVISARLPPAWRDSPFRLGLLCALPMLVITVPATVRYYWADLGNYRDGAAFLAKHRADSEPMVLNSRNDRMQGHFYLGRASLPTASPALDNFFLAGYADQHSGAFPVEFVGQPPTWILSAWRDVPAPQLYQFYRDGLHESFAGRSKFGGDLGLRIYRWDYDDRVLLPNSAATFVIDSQEGGSPVLIAGPGEWNIHASAPVDLHYPDGTVVSVAGRHSIKTERATRLMAHPVAGAVRLTAIPALPDRLRYRHDDAVTFPSHTHTTAIELGGESVLEPARDASFDFLVFQPDGPKRHLVVRMGRRDEAHAMLKRNDGQPVPPGMWFSVAIDGRPAGTWVIESGAPEIVEVPLGIELEPGNHRITVTGFVPRLTYSPYFPWLLAGIDWNAGPAANPVASLEEARGLPVSPGWSSVPRAAASTDGLAPPWLVKGAFPTTIDEEVTGPARDRAIRVDVPAGSKLAHQILGPPIPVQEGSIARYWFYYRLEGLNEHELTPMQVFVSAEGRPIGGSQYAMGANIMGTTFGKGWVRREVNVPVPPGASFLVPGIQSFPVDRGENTGAVIWLASFGTPGVAESFSDPSLPDGWFGFAAVPE